MIRNIKALGLALVAVLAMSAVVASGASAANFTASSYPPAQGEGGQTTNHVFTVQNQTVTCKEANFTGSLSAASSSMTITPEYDECTAFGFVGATVDVNCDFQFTVTGGGPTVYTGPVHVCPNGGSITVTAATCTVHVVQQTVGTVDYENSGNGVLVTSTATGIKSNVTSGFLCPLSSKEGDTTGKYTGTTQFDPVNVSKVDVG